MCSHQATNFASRVKSIVLFTGTYVLIWRRGNSLLTADKVMVVRVPKFRSVDGFNLEIGTVMLQDAGDYVCQIGDGHRDQINTGEILSKYRKWLSCPSLL